MLSALNVRVPWLSNPCWPDADCCSQTATNVPERCLVPETALFHPARSTLQGCYGILLLDRLNSL
jgi:hypothetical protein